MAKVREMCMYLYTLYTYVYIGMLVCCVCAQYRDYELVSMYSSVGTLHWASSCTLCISTNPVYLITTAGSDCPPQGQSCRSDCSRERATGPWS